VGGEAVLPLKLVLFEMFVTSVASIQLSCHLAQWLLVAASWYLCRLFGMANRELMPNIKQLYAVADNKVTQSGCHGVI
jgi:hypothetical protein